MGELATLGRYVLLEKLATGGMAELFLAVATGEAGFQKRCVVKRVLPHLASAPGFREMFLDEARLTARLSHPGLAQIFELGREGDAYFYAMEYLPGETAAAIHARAVERNKPVPCEVAAEIIASAAQALHHAHEALGDDGRPLGIVHRDVSPSNLMVTYLGQVKVLDFGIARFAQGTSHTEPGHLRGKASYMSPEQIAGSPIDRRTDVWALGVCLYELLAGARLFGRDTLLGAALAIHQQPIVPPSRLRADVPPELDAITLNALERDPDKRCASADALRLALERYLAGHTYVSGPTRLMSYLTELFGSERAKLMLQRAAPRSASSPVTAELPGEPSGTSTSEQITLTATKEDRGHTTDPQAGKRAPRALPRAALWGTAAAGAVALAAALGWPRHSPPPSPAAELPAHAADVAPAAPPPPQPEEKKELTAAAAAVPAEEPPPAVADQEAKPARPVARTERAEGTLSLTCELPAVAWLGNKRLGALPLQHVALPEGRARVKVVATSAAASKELTVRIAAGADTALHVSFGMGKLAVNSSPAWSHVFVDGKAIGDTPIAGQRLYEGDHEVRLVSVHSSLVRRVTIRADAETRLTEHVD